MQQPLQHLLDTCSGTTSRLEVLEGPTGRRSWSDEAKARIVLESYAPGVRVSDVARKHNMTPQHLTQWRRAAKEGRLALPGDDAMAFASIVVEDERPAASVQTPSMIAIEAAGVIVRVAGDCPAERIGEIIRVLRAA